MRDKFFNFLKYQIEFSQKEIRATIWLSAFAFIIGIVPHFYKMILISNCKPINIDPKELILIPPEDKFHNTSQVFYNTHEKSTLQFKKSNEQV